jgi:hypothetical protein
MFQVVLWRVRYKLSLRDWEARFGRYWRSLYAASAIDSDGEL